MNDSYNHVYSKIQDYMLTEANILRSLTKLQSYDNKTHIKKQETNIKKVDKDFFIPEHEDKLFWCFYIIKYGFEDYELNRTNIFTHEKQIKINSIEKIRKCKQLLKKHKLRVSEVEDELINQKKISYRGLFALSLVNDINILYTWDKKYIEIISNSEENTHIICNVNGDDGYIYNSSEEKRVYYYNNYWKIDNISKPLRGMSIYSLLDLKNICTKLNIPHIHVNGKNKTKKQLYENIIQKI